MSPLRPAIVLPLFVSLGLHAAIGWTVARHWSASAGAQPEPIQISYVETRKPVKTQAAQAPSESAQTAPKKKPRGIPVPRVPENEAPAQPHEPTDFEKVLETRLKQQERVLAKLNKPSKESPRSSTEILADPKKGKIFVEYFTEVRRKIQETLSGRYAHRYSVRGGVELGFVLNSKGFLEKVAVLSKGTDGDARLQELAVQCLRESAPFGDFPPELGTDRIAFNVTLYFVDR